MTILPFPATAERAQPIVRVSDLRQWCYCPRVVWWTHVCPLQKTESLKMRMGLAKERRLQRLQRRRTLRSFGLKEGTVYTNVTLHSARRGLTGKLDLMIHVGCHRYPVEVKFTRGPAQINHRLQLAGYAMLLEDEFGIRVPHGYIVRLPDDTADRVLIDDALREFASKVIDSLRKMLRDECMPPATPIAGRCVDCEYRRFCGDISCLNTRDATEPLHLPPSEVSG